MDNFERLSDDLLIQKIRQHENEDEITQYLMDKYKPLVLKKARAMFLVGGDTDDLIQEGMLGLFKALRDYRPNKNATFATFANLCVDRQLYSAVQSSNRKKHQPLNSYVTLSDEEFGMELEQFSAQNPEVMVIDRENAAGMEKTIQRMLSSFENEVLRLYLEGYDYIQIGELLDKPAKSIDNALQRIRSKVKKQIFLS